MRKRRRANRGRGRPGQPGLARALTPVVVALLAALFVAGCGLQTEQANKDLAQGTKHQEEAEAVLARFKSFSSDWQAIFQTAGITQAQIDKARALIAARGKDLEALDLALKNWAADLTPIRKLDVDDKIKEYVDLKLRAIKLWQDYSSMYLSPLVQAYGGMVETIAYGRPASEQTAKAQEITGLVTESVQKLEECRSAEKQAEDYFTDNKLGK